MELKVVDPKAAMLHIAFGITEERSNELSKITDDITRQFLCKKTPQAWAVLLAEIAKHCHTDEELVYYTTNNMNYLIYTGMMSPTPTKVIKV